MTQKFIEQLARGAGKILMSKYRKIKTVKTKSTVKDYLTQADLASDKFLVYQIKQAYPTHKIYSEERINGDLTDEYTWIIDPLDGTFGFVHELPMFCVSVALAYKNKIILSAIYDPIHDEMFTAVKGKGAFLNGKKIIRKKTNKP
jgi:fructose-1,6-bisphosphatase/inositol monophosphatase family enzyme